MQNDTLLKRLQDFEFLRGLDHETVAALADSAVPATPQRTFPNRSDAPTPIIAELTT